MSYYDMEKPLNVKKWEKEYATHNFGEPLKVIMLENARN